MHAWCGKFKLSRDASRRHVVINFVDLMTGHTHHQDKTLIYISGDRSPGRSRLHSSCSTLSASRIIIIIFCGDLLCYHNSSYS